MELTKTLIFWFELNNPAQAQEPQSTLHTDSNKDMCPRSSISLPALCLDLPMWPLEVCQVLLSESTSNNILCFKCIFELWLTIQHPVL